MANPGRRGKPRLRRSCPNMTKGRGQNVQTLAESLCATILHPHPKSASRPGASALPWPHRYEPETTGTDWVARNRTTGLLNEAYACQAMDRELVGEKNREYVSGDLRWRWQSFAWTRVFGSFRCQGIFNVRRTLLLRTVHRLGYRFAAAQTSFRQPARH